MKTTQKLQNSRIQQHTVLGIHHFAHVPSAALITNGLPVEFKALVVAYRPLHRLRPGYMHVRSAVKQCHFVRSWKSAFSVVVELWNNTSHEAHMAYVL